MRRSAPSRRQLAYWILSLVVVASMICSLVLMLRSPAPEPVPSPTPASPEAPNTPVPTPAPTQRPLTAAPPTRQPTPTPSEPVMPSFTPTATGDQPPTEGATSGERDFTFAVCGDNRDGPEVYRQVLERVQEDGSAFLIHTGDLVSYGSEARFQEFARMMQGFRLPFYPVPGNHDNFDGVLTAYLKYSGAPAAHYSFDYGLVHFSLIDTSLGEASKGELDWLAGDLEATDQPAKMVVLHHPPFDPAGTDHIMLRGNKEFMALMVEKGVNLILAGHIHSYDMAERDGVLYMITGGAGAPLYQEPNRPAFHHYVRVKVKGTDLSTEVVRLDKEG